MMLLGVASGLGAGIGAIAGYKVADALVGRSPTPPDGRVFRWIARNVDLRPRLTTFVIFGIAASPLPDTTVVMPLALVRYGMRRAALPLFLGKFAHNVLLVLIFYGVRVVVRGPRVGTGEHRPRPRRRRDLHVAGPVLGREGPRRSRRSDAAAPSRRARLSRLSARGRSLRPSK